ncbi:MAG: hypothetical protein IT385_17645 [Deltaproteobacteria bacterium]|nr:hypothetical protein [Deltaproteobacteria bacterium]
MDDLRRRIFARAAERDLPLARGGEAVRTALREAAPREREALVQSWFEALEALHGLGFGTDDAVAAARVSARQRVRIAPEHAWPLGTRVARRPIAAWLDRADALAWIEGAGADAALVELARGLAGPPPWPSWPGPPAPEGLALLVGPPAEIAALCAVAGVAVAPAAAVAAEAARPDQVLAPGVSAGRRRALEALEAGRPWVVPIARAELRARLRVVPTALARVEGAGGEPDVDPEDAEALGFEGVEEPAPISSSEAREALDPQRALEDARLLERPEERARAEALALVTSAGQASDPDEAERALTRVIDLARQGQDRDLVVEALIDRASALVWDAPERAHADLVEARRLAVAMRQSARAADIAALDEALLAATTMGAGSAEAPARALTRALLGAPGRAARVGLEVDRIGQAAVLQGAEAAAERVLRRLRDADLPQGLTGLVDAWITLLAARRGALVTAREALVARAHRDGAARARGTFGRRAAALAALAARTVGLDGLALAALEEAPARDPVTRLLRGEDVLGGGAPDYVLLLAAERDERVDGERRRAADALAARLGRLDEDALPCGVALVLGIARGDRRLLALATRGEPHVERQAIARLMAGADPASEEGQALARRHAALGGHGLGRAAEAGDHSPPFTPEEAQARALALVRAAAQAAAGRDVDAWARVIGALVGTIVEGRLAVASAALGLTLHELPGGRWRLVAGDDSAVLAAGPIVDTPAAIAGALEALAPLFHRREVAAPRGEPDPEGLDQALVEGRREFFADVALPFKRRELTRRTMKGLVHRGLEATHGLYRSLAERWRIDDYQRFMDFLRRGDVLLDYRAYRRGGRGGAAPPE